jgi:hypothetical protein
MKIHIENKTRYRTQDIRKLLLACINKDGIDRNWIKVEVQYQRGWTGGRATYYGSWMMIALRHPDLEMHGIQFTPEEMKMKQENTELESKSIEWWYQQRDPTMKFRLSDPKRVAHTIFHELQHLKGIHHEDMIEDYDVSWVDEKYPLRLKEEKPKPKINLKQVRYKHAQRMVKEKEQAVRRNKNLQRKWERRVRYYERLGLNASPSFR